jgi:hypothetical protein
MEQYKKIGVWHLQQYAYLLEKMKGIKEGESTLLDNSMILFGAGMRDGNAHSPHNLPIVLAGRGGGTIKSGRHIIYAKDSPLCNLYRSMLSRIGTPVETLADSTGELAGINDENYAGLPQPPAPKPAATAPAKPAEQPKAEAPKPSTPTKTPPASTEKK